ncbi:hypothetical protein M405DRAFT_863710 [Rhizopogon salebrosus TDB-379]|nr:hypothetical protein M405DRAFT_863710 [Rhizopogon salebrosus TDB-379]
MAPVDWNALAPRKVSPAKTKEDELLARWTGVTERLATEAMCRPDDKEELEDDMRSWVRRWDEISVEVEALQDVAKDLGITDKLSFGDSFAAIREALRVQDEWKTRFDAADAVKAAKAAKAAEVAKAADVVEVVDVEMEDDDGVDEESVLSGSKKGKGRVLPHRDQVKKVAVVVPVITPGVVPEVVPEGDPEDATGVRANDPICSTCQGTTKNCVGKKDQACVPCRIGHLSCEYAKKNIARKTATPANPPSVAGASGDVVEPKAVPGPSRKGKKGGRKTKWDPMEEVEEEVLNLMEIENDFRRMATDLLRKANDLCDWREAKFGQD